VHELMSWLWRDTRRITHRVSRVTDRPAYITQVSYKTWCGTTVTVDDVNPRTQVDRGTPTCVRCAVSEEPE
jgi:hypothetical protein